MYIYETVKSILFDLFNTDICIYQEIHFQSK